MKSFLKSIVSRLEPNHGDHTKISSLEGIRGFAVFTVFVAHYTILIEPWIDKKAFGTVAFNFLQFYGYFGVDMFFAVSGYLIYSVVMKDRFVWQQYAKKRFLRIYPPYLAAILLYVALCFAVPSQSKLPSGFWDATLFVVQNLAMLPGVFNFPILISQAWSLSYEMCFYIGLPLLVWLVQLRKSTAVWRISIYAVGLAGYWGYCLAVDHSPTRFSAFVLGMLACELKPFLPNIKVLGALGLAAAVLTIPFAVLRMADQMSYVSTYVINCLLIFIAFVFGAFHRNVLSHLLSLKLVRWFGNMSYSYFLFHGLALKIMMMGLSVLREPASSGTMLYYVFAPFCFAATMIISLAAYYWVEYPLSIARTLRPSRLKESGTASTG